MNIKVKLGALYQKMYLIVTQFFFFFLLMKIVSWTDIAVYYYTDILNLLQDEEYIQMDILFVAKICNDCDLKNYTFVMTMLIYWSNDYITPHLIEYGNYSKKLYLKGSVDQLEYYMKKKKKNRHCPFFTMNLEKKRILPPIILTRVHFFS